MRIARLANGWWTTRLRSRINSYTGANTGTLTCLLGLSLLQLESTDILLQLAFFLLLSPEFFRGPLLVSGVEFGLSIWEPMSVFPGLKKCRDLWRRTRPFSLPTIWRQRSIARRDFIEGRFHLQLLLQQVQEELLKRLGGQPRRIVSGVLLDGVIVDKVVGQAWEGVGFEGVKAVFADPGK